MRQLLLQLLVRTHRAEERVDDAGADGVVVRRGGLTGEHGRQQPARCAEQAGLGGEDGERRGRGRRAVGDSHRLGGALVEAGDGAEQRAAAPLHD